MKSIKNKAFTLIELLVVIAIISLLSSIVFASLSSAREKAQDTHRVSEAKEVEKAIELYRLDNNYSVPGVGANANLRGTLHEEGTLEYDTLMSELVTGGYIPAIPESPSGTDYAYIVSTDGTSAMFYSNQSDNSTTGDVCVRVGDNTFGATGTGTSCEGSIVASGSGVTYCGLPPYLVKYSQYQGSYAGDWFIEIGAVDPEGDVVTYTNSWWEPNSGFECGIYTQVGEFPISPVQCTDYGGGDYIDITFSGLSTPGCSSVHSVIDFVTLDIY